MSVSVKAEGLGRGAVLVLKCISRAWSFLLHLDPARRQDGTLGRGGLAPDDGVCGDRRGDKPSVHRHDGC